MANTYFQFKQFTVFHDQTAMKVGTDGVLLGAWADVSFAKKILDIGTGTGLIALMTAQKSTAQINAVEIEKNAFIQAKKNVENSKWKTRITTYNIDFQTFARKSTDKYDCLLCNPPYFVNSYQSADFERMQARHNRSLPFDELLFGVAQLIGNRGVFYVILPCGEKENFIELASVQKLFCNKILQVKPTPNKAPKRVLLAFQKIEKPIMEQIISIETGVRHSYTDEYKEITKDYYLNF